MPLSKTKTGSDALDGRVNVHTDLRLVPVTTPRAPPKPSPAASKYYGRQFALTEPLRLGVTEPGAASAAKMDATTPVSARDPPPSARESYAYLLWQRRHERQLTEVCKCVVYVFMYVSRRRPASAPRTAPEHVVRLPSVDASRLL